MARKAVKTPEQIDFERAAYALSALREETINEPTVQWQVGERVKRGNITEVYVDEILDNGKIIKLRQVNVDGEDSQFAGRVMESTDYVAWHELNKYWTVADYSEMPIFMEDQDLRIHYSQRDIFGVFVHYYHSGFNMDTDYQRGNVWTKDDKVKLIDSIFHNVDIGKFVFIHKKNIMEKVEVLDGKQRLTALIEFKERRFTYQGLNYDQLHWKDKNHFDHYPISWGDVNSGNFSEPTDEQKYRYFLRLNTGGKVQDPGHIKKVEALWKEAKLKSN